MTGLPTVTVALDDGTGAFPYDVTTLCRLPESLSWSRGRSDEHSDNQPGALALAFDNLDGAFSPGQPANLQVNPSLESAFGPGGGQVGTSLQWSFDAVTKLSGTRSVQVAPVGAAGNIGVGIDRVPVLPSTTYTFSIWIRRAAGAGNIAVDLDLLDAGGAHITASAATNLSLAAAPVGTWVRAVVTATTTAATAFVRGRQYLTTYVNGTDVFNADLAQVELGSVATWQVFNDQGLRVQVNGANRWTGKVQSWPVSWPGGSGGFSIATATATDALATAARWQLDSASQLEILADSPTGYWPLSEESEFATQARDLTGLLPVLRATHPAGASALKFGQDLGTPDGAKGVQFNSSTVGNSDNLQATGDFTYTGTGIHIEVTFNLSAALPASGFLDLVTGLENGVGVGSSFRIALENGDVRIGRGQGDAGYTVAIANMVGVHTIALDTDAAGSHLRFDDTLIDSRAGFAHSYDLTGSSFLEVGGSFIASSGPALSCVIGHLVIGTKLSDARTSVHQDAILNDLSGETVSTRVARVLGYAGLTAGSIDAAGDTILGPVNQAGRSVLDVLTETATADGGDVYADADGAISYVAGVTIAGRVTPAAFDANWLGEDTQVVTDMFGVVNTATGTRSSGGNVVGPIVDAVSQAAHGVYPEDFSWNVNSDAQVVDRTNWQVATYAEPSPRVTQLVLDLLTMDAPTLAAALALDLTSFLRATGMPAQTPGGTTLDVIVESITDTMSEVAWTLTLNVSAKALRGAWVLGDATYGVLDSTTKLYI